jgi:hypothetical protein
MIAVGRSEKRRQQASPFPFSLAERPEPFNSLMKDWFAVNAACSAAHHNARFVAGRNQRRALAEADVPSSS